MFDLLRQVPAMQNIEEITTEFSETVIKVLKLCFQSAILRCTGLALEGNCITKEECKLLKYSRALPLALQHRRVENFNDLLVCLDKLDTLNDIHAIFKERLKKNWRLRINFILPYSENENYLNSIEASERQIALEFSTTKIKTSHFLSMQQ